MKKIFLFLLAALFAAELSAQQLKVVHFEMRERDLTAKVKPRTDNNGDICALLRVQIAAPNCQFDDSYIVGDVELGFGEYLVYMAKGARRLRVAHPDFLFTTLDYEFPEALQSMTTYTLVLEVPVYTHYAEIVEQQSKNNSAQPAAQPAPKSATQPAKPTEKVYKVGDYYNENGKEGVVFWVDETGKHGKIISLSESSFLQWSSDKAFQKKIVGCFSSHRGGQNMDVIMKILGWREKFPALTWCADLGEGWYLPAEEELAAISKVFDLLNSSLIKHGGKALSGRGGFYLSSSESEIYGKVARHVHVKKGEIYDTSKSYNQYVRAVATF